MAKGKLLLAYYGDDFTGSTDALEFMTKAGAKTILFLKNPEVEDLAKIEDYDAIGIAGMTRAMRPEEMKATLSESFGALAALLPKHLHYKVCSTFDSSKEIGNIGVAIETGKEVLNQKSVPVLVAAPNLGRFQAFGNLFARMGIGSQGAIYRLDLHPSMSKHPTTPAHESDLLIHLSDQTDLSLGLVDLLYLERSQQEYNDVLAASAEKYDVVFLDAMYAAQMKKVGAGLETLAASADTLFSVGSSGVENALGDHWQAERLLEPCQEWPEIDACEQLLVLSGSMSPVTADQIHFAEQAGFVSIGVDVAALQESETESYINQYSDQINELLSDGENVILYTTKGPNDERVKATQDYFEHLGLGEMAIRASTAKLYGKILGQTANNVLKKHSLKRIVIAGGDTSSFVARELGIDAVEMIAPIYPGSPLCKIHSHQPEINGMEVNLKGGQVGDEQYFLKLKNGK